MWAGRCARDSTGDWVYLAFQKEYRLSTDLNWPDAAWESMPHTKHMLRTMGTINLRAAEISCGRDSCFPIYLTSWITLHVRKYADMVSQKAVMENYHTWTTFLIYLRSSLKTVWFPSIFERCNHLQTYDSDCSSMQSPLFHKPAVSLYHVIYFSW